MNTKKLAAAGALLTVAALSLSACAAPSTGGGSEVDISSFDALVEAAQAEGALSVYGEIQEADLERFAAGFKEEYGIDVETLRLGGNSLAQRFDAEIQAGSRTADVLIGVDPEFFNEAIGKDHLVAFEESGVPGFFDGFPAEFSFTEFGVPLLQTIATGFIYNTDLVDAGDIPQTWQDLVGSDRWAGKYCSVDPSTSASVTQFFSVMRAAESDEVLTAFGDGIGRWYPNIVALNEAVSVGECELGINSAQFFVEGMKAAAQAPVEFAAGPTTIYPTPTAAVVTSAENPNAARLFLHYILSPEGNALLNNPAGGSFGPWDGATIPADFWVPTSEDFQRWRSEGPEIARLLGV